jgi:predicted TIM-barrel fold metal-dependent hydrolase
MNDRDNGAPGGKLPVKIDTTTNGEFAPKPLPKASIAANQVALSRADAISKALGVTRRQFLASVSGVAATFGAFNDVYAALGAKGGRFEMPKEAPWELAAAESVLVKKEFIFDIQNHHVSPRPQWRNPNSPWRPMLHEMAERQFADMSRRAACVAPSRLSLDDQIGACLSRDVYVKEMFLDSETSMAVLSFVPSREEDMPLSTEEGMLTKQVVDALDGTERLLLHARVIPNLPGDLERMQKLARSGRFSAWKTYTQFAGGWWLDDERYGIPFIEQVRRSGTKVICIHKGLPLPPMGKEIKFSRCDDVGRVAKKYPDVTFIIYHSGYDDHTREGQFVPGSMKGGIDSLIQSLLDNGIAANSNVYAELGSTWRTVMSDPDQSAHVIGKLLRYVGEDRVVWGTDSIWYGSPQDQIQAFRLFQISDEFCDRYGYPKLTAQIKTKIFGLNAVVPYKVDPARFLIKSADDSISRLRSAYADARDPSLATYGPRTRSEFLRFRRLSNGQP